MKRLYPAKWRTADQYVRTINDSPVSPVMDTLAESIVMHDPFHRLNLLTVASMFVGTTLRINGF